MTTKPSQIRLTDTDKAKIEVIREQMGLPSASSAIRHAIDRRYRELLLDDSRAAATEARHNYNRGLGLD